MDRFADIINRPKPDQRTWRGALIRLLAETTLSILIGLGGLYVTSWHYRQSFSQQDYILVAFIFGLMGIMRRGPDLVRLSIKATGRIEESGHTIKQYVRLKFPGAMEPGTCHVKALVRNGGLVVLVTQLKNYTGTSVTNSWEDIAPIVIDRLRNDLSLSFVVEPKPWWKFWDKSGPSRAEIMAKTRWIEYYPPMTGLHHDGSIAEVIPGPPMVWLHSTKEILARDCRVPISFLQFQDAQQSILDFKIPVPPESR